MASVNKVILVGNLGRDPETSYSPDGAAITNVSVATTSTWKDKNTGEKREETEWHHVALFGRLGEIAGEYLRKGSQVYIEGRLRTRKWQDKEGRDRYTTENVGSDMQMLRGTGGGGGGGGGFADAPSRAEPAEASMGGGSSGGASAPRDDFDDDI